MDDARGRLTPDQLREMVAGGAVTTVINAICDMQGRLMGKRVAADYFVEHCLDGGGTHFCVYLLGTDMEMTTPSGFRLMDWESGYGDWLARPDLSTLRLIPWLERTALVLADAVDEATGALISVAPRTILRRQIERAAALGLRARLASELEFFVVKGTYETAHAAGYRGLEPFGWYSEDYHLFQGTKLEPLYRPLREGLSAAGVPVECSKGEAGAGQHEVNVRYADALEAADRHALLKHGAKEIALLHGYALTFMAKPDHAWLGSSSHIHVSLWDDAGERGLFHDPAAPGGMSATMRHFLGGLMAHARDLSLFVAPNVNSYKRYAVASWAPVHLVWGRDNRTCGFRIVGHGPSLRIENRLPGADVNPYLAYAAILAAGLAGVERRIEPPDEHRGNGYTATDAPRMPRALYEAIDALDESALARAAFGDEVIDHYLNAARVEQTAYDAAVTTWERERYFERG
jgi:glutamine synthetase